MDLNYMDLNITICKHHETMNYLYCTEEDKVIYCTPCQTPNRVILRHHACLLLKNVHLLRVTLLCPVRPEIDFLGFSWKPEIELKWSLFNGPHSAPKQKHLENTMIGLLDAIILCTA